MNLRHKIKLHLSKSARQYCAKAAGIQRFAYNWAKEESDIYYKEHKKTISVADLVKKFTQIKDAQFPWVREVTKCAPQYGIHNYCDARERFFRKLGKFPKFHKKWKHRDSFHIELNSVGIKGKRIKIPRFGWVKMWETVRFPGKVKSVTIFRHADDWFASVLVDVDPSYQYPHTCKNQAAVVGIDLGLIDFVTMSDGQTIAAPKFYRKMERKLRMAHKKLDRCVKGSSNKEKARKKLAKLYQKSGNQRSHFSHDLSSKIVREHGKIGMETLGLTGLVKNRRVSKSFYDAALGTFVDQIKYKSVLADSKLIQVSKNFPSTKMCSTCNHVREHMSLDVRSWTCDHCNTAHDRDMNAALNLHKFALEYRENPNACGDAVRPRKPRFPRRVSAKQESTESSNL